MMPKVILLVLWLVGFGSFARARGRQFMGDPSARMRLTAAAGLVVSLVQAFVLWIAPLGWTAWPAAGLFAGSVGLFWWSARTHRQAPLSLGFSSDGPSRLVVTGPYRYIRHPYYAAYMLFWLAGASAAGQAWELLLVGIMGLVYRQAATHEEALFASGEWAEAYAAYRQRTGRFLPVRACGALKRD